MSKLDKLSITDFASELGSASPAPGGGSTAALAGALAASLVGMVGSITLKRSDDSANNEKLQEIIRNSEEIRKKFLQLINEDTVAFNNIIQCFKLPKSTATEQQARSAAIQAATKHAVAVPLSTAENGLKILNYVKALTEVGSDVTITDTGVAGLMAYSAIKGAIWNVKINLPSIKDSTYVSETRGKVETILETTSELWREIPKSIEEKL